MTVKNPHGLSATNPVAPAAYPDGARVSILDPTRVAANASLAVGHLARLCSAIIEQQKRGVEFDPSIRVEVGNGVALLVSCVKQGDDNGDSRSSDYENSGTPPASGGVRNEADGSDAPSEHG